MRCSSGYFRSGDLARGVGSALPDASLGRYLDFLLTGRAIGTGDIQRRTELSSFPMDIRLTSQEELSSYNKIPIPRQTPTETIENLRSLCTNNDLETFQHTIKLLLARSEPGCFFIEELEEVMMEAIKHDNTEFVSTLLSHGFPVQPSYTVEATLRKAKGTLACYIKEGWDINKPVGGLRPSVLG